jgi:hypothetical protein
MRLIKKFRLVMGPKLRHGHKKTAALVFIQFSVVHTFMLSYEIYPSAPVSQSVSFMEDCK